MNNPFRLTISPRLTTNLVNNAAMSVMSLQQINNKQSNDAARNYTWCNFVSKYVICNRHGRNWDRCRMRCNYNSKLTFTFLKKGRDSLNTIQFMEHQSTYVVCYINLATILSLIIYS